MLYNLIGAVTIGIYLPLDGGGHSSLTNIDKFAKTLKLQLSALFSIHFMKCCTSLMTCMLGNIQNYFYVVVDQKLSFRGLRFK